MADLRLEEVFDELKKLRNDAVKFQNMKSRYVEFATRIKDLHESQLQLNKESKEWRDNVEKTILNKQMQINKDWVALAHDIDPFTLVEVNGSGSKKKKSGSRVPNIDKVRADELLNEVYDKVLQGVHMNIALITHTYTELSDNQALWLFQRLKKMPRVLIRKDGSHVFVYTQKEVR